MYESPIKITYSEPEAIELASIAERIGQGIAAQQEEYIYGAIAKMGVIVDKDELVKAIQYDRDQYKKGYADGRASRDADIVRCKDCRYGKEVCGNIECSVDLNYPSEYHGYDWFCPSGERRDND